MAIVRGEPIEFRQCLFFVDSTLIASRERHARTARVNQARNALRATRVEHIKCSDEVRFVEPRPRPANAGNRGGVKHGVYALARFTNRRDVSDVATNDFYAEGSKFRVVTATETADLITSREELLDDRTPQKSSSTGN
jgi:hypothetical protein